MDIYSKLSEIKSNHKIKLSEGKDFTQAVSDGRMLDSPDCIADKIILILKHYPNSEYISLATYESDETSDHKFCYAIAAPHLSS